MEYSIKINEKSFTIDDINLDFSDLILKSAPVLYLYKYHNDESMYEQLSMFAYCSIYCNYILHDLARIKENSISTFFDDEEINKKFITFLSETKKVLLRQTEGNNYINTIDELNLWDCFGRKKRLYGYISDIFFSCNNFIKQRNEEIYFHILDRIKILLNTINKQLHDEITRITLYVNTDDNKKNSVENILPEFIFSRIEKEKVISELEKIIQNNFNILSNTPANSANYLNTLASMINNAVNIDSDIFNERCMAIIEDQTGLYFSFSNKQDYIKNTSFFEKERGYAEILNQKYFDNNAKWCYLSGRTKNYIEVSTYSKNNYKYINSIPDFTFIKNEEEKKYWHFYSCCERKILGLHNKVANFNLFVMLSPCEKCTKALVQYHYKKIFALLEYRKGWKNGYLSLFKPKEYTINLENGMYICKEK